MSSVEPRVGGHPAAMAGPPVGWGGVRRLLAVRPDNLGDVVLLGPALRALRAAAPDAAIDLLASPAGAAVAPLLGTVDGVVVCSPAWQDARADGFDTAADADLVARVAAGRYDAAVIFTSFSQSPWPAAAVCARAGIPVRVGASKEFGGALLTHWADDVPDGLHQVDRALTLLERVGVPASGSELALEVPPAAVEAAATALGPAARRGYAVVLPGASCPSRRYSPERFATVAGRLAAAGLTVVVAGTAKEADLVDRVVAGAGPGAVRLVGVLDVPALAALVSGADVVVTNNSGGMHLADAVGTPQVALFAGTEREAEYRPRSAPAVLLRRETACSPCRAFVCPFHGECLDIAPDLVVRTTLELTGRAAA